jgi:hypothetical protein
MRNNPARDTGLPLLQRCNQHLRGADRPNRRAEEQIDDADHPAF